MNNSFPRVIDGMIEALRKEIIPHTTGDFARGQAFGVIFMLETLKRRADWSAAFLRPQLQAQSALASALEPLLPAHAPRVGANDDGDASAPAMLAARDEGDARIAAVIDWLAVDPTIDPAKRRAAETEIDRYITLTLRHELTTSARPMFAEISLGRDIEKV